MKRLVKASVVVFFCMLLSVCAYAAGYEVYVGGTQITDDNASDVFGDGTVSYDAQTSTLTLSNAVINGAYEYETGNFAGIFTKSFINIALNGENTLNTKVEDATCNIGIYCHNASTDDKALLISGGTLEDTLTVISGDAENITAGINAHYGEIEIRNASVEVNSGDSVSSSFGIICGDGATCGSIAVDGASVIVKAGNITIPDENAEMALSYGVAACDVTVRNSAYLRAVGGDANSTSGIMSIGLYAVNSISVDGNSKVDAKGGGTGEMTGTETIPETVSFVSVGVRCDGIIDVMGRSVFNGRAGDVWTYNEIVAACKAAGILCQGILTVEDNSFIYGRGNNANTEVLGISATEIVMADSELRGVANSYTGGSVECIGIDVSAEILNATAVNYNDGIEEFVEGEGYSLPYLGVYSNYTGITRYGIFVGGIELTSENCDDVFGDGTVSFDPETVTLTLNNAHITGGYEIQYEETAGIYVNQKTTLTINLIGENTIDSGEYYSYRDVGIHYAYEVTNANNVIVITGDETASLDVTSNAEYESYGILAEAGNVVVENVTLNVNGSDTTRTSVGIFVQTANNSLIIDNAVVNATGGDVTGSGNSCASSGLGGGSIYIQNGSTVTATGGEIVCTETTTESRSSGILMIGYLDVSTGSTLNAIGGDTYSENGDANSVGIYCLGQTDVREGCTVNASSGCSVDTNKDTDNDCQSIGLAQTLITVNVGNEATINASAGYSDDLSAGVYIEDISTDPEYDETIVFETENGVVIAISGEVGEGGASVGIYTENEIVNGTVRNFETGEVLTYNGGIYTDSDGNLITSATINGGVILFGDYNLVVGGIQVTEKNKDDILGELDGDAATAYYDPDTKTLTLENANITTYYDMDGAYVGILRMGDLNVNLIGENKVCVSSYEEVPGAAVGIAAFGDLEITSDSSAYLEVVAGDTDGESYGLFSAPMDSEEFIFDITVSGRANVVTRSGSINYEGNYYTAGACAFGTLNVLDSANLYGYAGKAAYSGSSSNNYGVSVGLMSYSTMNINTTGTVYGYGEKSDFVFCGIGVSSELNVENGVVIGEAGSDVPENAVAAGVVAQIQPENVIAKTGADAETLTENVSWYVPEANIGGVYTDENSVIGRYTLILPEGTEFYDLWVGGVQVTTVNMTDVLGDGAVSYDPLTKTLTLNNATIDTYSKNSNSNCGIYSEGDLNIVLVGENSINVSPDESDLEVYAIAVKCNGNITVTSEETATLDIDVGTATRENFGFNINGSLAVSGKVELDIKLGDIEITDEFEDVNDTYGNSIGIHCSNSAYFYDDVSVKCETGNIFVPEDSGFVGNLENINSGGTTVGIAVYGDLFFDTTGELYFYINDSDGKRAGVASFSNFDLKQGSIVVEMSESKGDYLVAGAAVYVTEDGSCPCIPLCGPDASNIETGTIINENMAGYPLNVYADKNGELARYTKIVASVVGMPKVETDTQGGTNVSVSVEDEEKASSALIVFASYNENGKMLDVKFENGTSAVDGRISSDLDVTGAVKVTVFVFENNVSLQPLSPELTTTVITEAA